MLHPLSLSVPALPPTAEVTDITGAADGQDMTNANGWQGW